MGSLDLSAKSLALSIGGGESNGSAVAKVGIDAVVRQGVAQVTDRRTQGGREVTLTIDADEIENLSGGRGEECGGPSAVSATRAESAGTGFEDGNAQRGVAPQQFTSGPQSRKAATDDADIDVEITGESGTRQRQRPVPPQRLAGGGVHLNFGDGFSEDFSEGADNHVNF